MGFIYKASILTYENKSESRNRLLAITTTAHLLSVIFRIKNDGVDLLVFSG